MERVHRYLGTFPLDATYTLPTLRHNGSGHCVFLSTCYPNEFLWYMKPRWCILTFRLSNRGFLVAGSAKVDIFVFCAQTYNREARVRGFFGNKSDKVGEKALDSPSFMIMSSIFVISGTTSSVLFLFYNLLESLRLSV